MYYVNVINASPELLTAAAIINALKVIICKEAVIRMLPEIIQTI